MTFEQLMQLAGLIVTGVTTWRGFKAVEAKLTNYVSVDDYRAKVSALHDQINGLREQVIRLEERAKK